MQQIYHPFQPSVSFSSFRRWILCGNTQKNCNIEEAAAFWKHEKSLQLIHNQGSTAACTFTEIKDVILMTKQTLFVMKKASCLNKCGNSLRCYNALTITFSKSNVGVSTHFHTHSQHVLCFLLKFMFTETSR